MRTEFDRVSPEVRAEIVERLNNLPALQQEAPEAQVLSCHLHGNGNWELQAFLIRKGATASKVNSALGRSDAVDDDMMRNLSPDTWYFARTTLNYQRQDETEILHSRQSLLGPG